MPAIETYTTTHLPPGQRIEFWNDWIGSYFSSIETSPSEPKKYNASLLVGRCGDLTIAEAESTPAVNNHPEHLIAGVGHRNFLLHLQTAGTSTTSQGGSHAVLRKGDFTLCDNTRPYSVSFSSSHRILVMRIPEYAMINRLPDVERLMCIPMACNSGVNNMVSRFISRFWRLCQQGIDPAIEGRLANNVLDLLATSFADSRRVMARESSVQVSRRLMVKDHIEQNLGSPDLGPTSIAGKLGYSTGYLHQIFKGESETISQYIIRRRVQESARMLADPQFATRSISEVAYGYGFNSLTHFGRVFKEHFGASPSEYRSQTR